MTRKKKIVLGVLTLLPWIFLIIYFIGFFIFFKELPFDDPERYNPEPVAVVGNFIGLLALIFIGAAISIGLMIYYLIHVSKNKKLGENERIVWIVVLIFANSIGSIVYFFMHIMPLPEQEQEEHLEQVS